MGDIELMRVSDIDDYAELVVVVSKFGNGLAEVSLVSEDACMSITVDKQDLMNAIREAGL